MGARTSEESGKESSDHSDNNEQACMMAEGLFGPPLHFSISCMGSTYGPPELYDSEVDEPLVPVQLVQRTTR